MASVSHVEKTWGRSIEMLVCAAPSDAMNLTEQWANLSLNLSAEVLISDTGPELYYGERLHQFRNDYAEIHGYLSLVVCGFGIVANILNIIVLTRRDLISPTNAILTALAVPDMFVMVSYVPFTIHNYLPNNKTLEEQNSFAWAVFTLFHAHFTVICHTISTWLTVTLAIWRFLAVSFPTSSKAWCCMRRAYIAIAATYITCMALGWPQYLSFTIQRISDEDALPHKGVFYTVRLSEISQYNNQLIEKINFWTFSVIFKLVPCIALTGLSLGLIRVLYEANQRKHRLKKGGGVGGGETCSADKSCDRTTRMLLAVLLLFLITEFPSGILSLLSGILGKEFFKNVYMNFGEVMDILAMTNSAVNFILYCSMSRQFRDTFKRLFTPRILSRWMAVPKEPTTCASTCV
ncbi:dmsr-8 [Cordylochernes scorpioides]|uniref:Dmsr-8 n=1 Tax=Cordylochernes scorpioides TaxID=51811 RepID=A0ABY6LAB9_9ARAC|nr:dmsr-8 [Cordylochernes scorpioides]